ncbi:MAG: hypothetical protein Q9167_003362 [Letrouitia subvulpina]
MKQVDIVSFIEIEMDQRALTEQGWSQQSLQTLFDWDFVPSFDLQDDRVCNDCLKEIAFLTVQPYWLCLLEQIKQGISFGSLQGSGGLQHDAFINKRIGKTASDKSWIEDEAGQSPGQHPVTNIDALRCGYEYEDVTCMDCWLHYKRTGRRSEPPGPHWENWFWFQDSFVIMKSIRVQRLAYILDDENTFANRRLEKALLKIF